MKNPRDIAGAACLLVLLAVRAAVAGGAGLESAGEAADAEKALAAAEAGPLRVIVEGVQVEPPAGAANIRDFLERLAERSGTLTTQSFLSYAATLPAPKLPGGRRSSYEILAETLSGRPASFEITPEGNWQLFGDKDGPPCYYGARGGVLFAANPGTKVGDAPGLELAGRLYYRALEGVIGHAGVVPRWADPMWLPPGQGPVVVTFEQQAGEGGKPKYVGHARIAVVTRWAELKLTCKEAREQQRIEKDGIVLEVGGFLDAFEVPGEISDLELKLSWLQEVTPQLMQLLLRAGSMQYLGPAGTPVAVELNGSFSAGPTLCILKARFERSIDPATTVLSVRLPGKFEILDLPLELYNVPAGN